MSCIIGGMLTPRQDEVLRFIRQFCRAEGYPPTIREIGRGVGIRSLRGVTGHLEALVRKGYLRRGRQARGLKLLVEGERSRPVTLHPSPVSLPLLGRIAAGQPVLAEGTEEGQVVVDRRLAPTPGCFVVRVHGESMTGAGILHGDFCVVRPQPVASNGEVVAVLIDGEATVKRFYRERGVVRLQPENPAVQPLRFREADLAGRDVRVLGRVVGVLRKL